ncbi:lysophospholipid acyltransferase family protein [Megasphaera vaginalis (ex Bordigoni et al. 2020)]|uniref:lysophospholipid acyltransferase family protein n=1 Tax=Megasphaera vaginalis (ex Bordigoni et al. 2020) TaxID=2045301 RepID=UPI000C7A73AF|nr:lysophospholipid acyltransferase family protein [Megasphaera vaginalis (ex Bordigoni et al. 2020)]
MSNGWQYHTVRAIGKFVCLFSYSTIISWGRALRPLIGKVLKKQRKRGVFHIMRGLRCSEERANEIIDELFRNLGQSLMEILYTPRLTRETISDYVVLDHPERLEAALAENKGVIVLTGHIGNWEWMGAALALYGYPTTTIVKKQPNDQVTRFLNENRERMGLEVFARGGNEMIIAARALKRKKLLGFLADQDGGFYGVPQVFLGKMASTPRGPAMFAKQFKSPVVPVFVIHDESHRHRVIIGEALYYRDTGDKEADIAAFTRQLAVLTESFITDHPTEWLWFQHRWSTAPEEIVALQKKAEEQN